MEVVVEAVMWAAYIVSLYFLVFLLLVFLDRKNYSSWGRADAGDFIT